MTDRIRILGIDPGSRITGYGIVDSDGYRSQHIASGSIRAGGGPFGERLEIIFQTVRGLVEQYRPAQVAVERVFLNRNADSALKLGQARAAAICATFGQDIELFEYAARAVKQAVVGRGGAHKQQVRHMIQVLLKLGELPGEDQADALAVALCHAHQQPLTVARQAAAGAAQ